MNNPSFSDIECSKCGSSEVKQLPAKWNEGVVIEYYPNWFFCNQCGSRLYVYYEENKAC